MGYEKLACVVRDAGRQLGEIEDESTGYYKFNDEAELLRVLARILEGKDTLRAFGSPGDWGYSSPIGSALAERWCSMTIQEELHRLIEPHLVEIERLISDEYRLTLFARHTIKPNADILLTRDDLDLVPGAIDLLKHQDPTAWSPMLAEKGGGA